MKKSVFFLMIAVAFGLVACGNSQPAAPAEVQKDLKGCDMATFDNGKVTFYNSTQNAFIPFVNEKDYVVSGVFEGLNVFFYTVAKDNELYLKQVTLDDQAKLVDITDWNLKLSDCYDESCEKCASMVYYIDVDMVGIEHNMGEMCKGFQDVKYYQLENKTMSDGWPEGVDNGFIMYQDFIDNVHFIAMPVEEGGKVQRYYYCPEDYGMYSEEELPEHLICISDKINFHEDRYEGWDGEPEFSILSVSPNSDCAAYAAIMEWGRGGRGPLCFATLDGKVQKILAYDANCGWLEDGRLAFNDEEGIKTVSPDGTVKKLTDGKYFVTNY